MNKHYCFTDLHGCYDLWRQIKNYCDETDTLYFLGDAIDRGPDGVVLMEELLKDKRVIYLKGNHEHMRHPVFQNIFMEILNFYFFGLPMAEDLLGTLFLYGVMIL